MRVSTFLLFAMLGFLFLACVPVSFADHHEHDNIIDTDVEAELDALSERLDILSTPVKTTKVVKAKVSTKTTKIVKAVKTPKAVTTQTTSKTASSNNNHNDLQQCNIKAYTRYLATIRGLIRAEVFRESRLSCPINIDAMKQRVSEAIVQMPHLSGGIVANQMLQRDLRTCKNKYSSNTAAKKVKSLIELATGVDSTVLGDDAASAAAWQAYTNGTAPAPLTSSDAANIHYACAKDGSIEKAVPVLDKMIDQNMNSVQGNFAAAVETAKKDVDPELSAKAKAQIKTQCRNSKTGKLVKCGTPDAVPVPVPTPTPTPVTPPTPTPAPVTPPTPPTPTPAPAPALPTCSKRLDYHGASYIACDSTCACGAGSMCRKSEMVPSISYCHAGGVCTYGDACKSNWGASCNCELGTHCEWKGANSSGKEYVCSSGTGYCVSQSSPGVYVPCA